MLKRICAGDKCSKMATESFGQWRMGVCC